MYEQPGRVITPEAVLLEVRHAGPGTRIAARGLDALVQGGLVVVLFVALTLAATGTSGGTALAIIGLAGTFLVIFGYPAIMEAAWRGRTLGKAAFGLRVVTRQGAPITFRHAAIRSALFLVDGLLIGPSIGVICLLVTRDTVRLGDLVAGTTVLRERSGATPPSAVTFTGPPGYDRYVTTLDVGVLDADDYALVRGFLTRAARLRPEARIRLALDIADRTAARLHLGPQPMSPETFLWCVAAAVQHRAGSYQDAVPAGTSGGRTPPATQTPGPEWAPAAPQEPGWAPPSGDADPKGPGFAPPA